MIFLRDDETLREAATEASATELTPINLSCYPIPIISDLEMKNVGIKIDDYIACLQIEGNFLFEKFSHAEFQNNIYLKSNCGIDKVRQRYKIFHISLSIFFSAKLAIFTLDWGYSTFR